MEHFFSPNSSEDQKKVFTKFGTRCVARNSQWGGVIFGLEAEHPAAGGTGVWGRSPQRSKILHFFAKIA